MYIRNQLCRSMARIFPFVLRVVPIGPIAIYQRAGLLWVKPMQSERNPGKRLMKGNRYD